MHFKRWQVKVTLWLTAMNVFYVSNGKSEGELSDGDQKKFAEATIVFLGCIFSVHADCLYDGYMHMADAKVLWDALNAKFGASDVGSELYVMENFHDKTMEENHSVVEQAHEIECIVKELKLLKCPLPEKFVAGALLQNCIPCGRVLPQH